MSVLDWIEKKILHQLKGNALPQSKYYKLLHKSMTFVSQDITMRHDPYKITSAVSEELFRAPINQLLVYIEATLLGTILEDVITQMRILSECNNEIRILKTKSDMKYLTAVKYGVKQPPVTDELADIDPQNLTCETYKINKLEFDRKFFEEILTSTYIDIAVNRSFQALTNHLKKRKEHEEYRVLIADCQVKNKCCLRELHKQLRQQRNHFKTVIYDTDCFINTLKSQVEDASITSETQSRYVENWQRARTEQHVQSINHIESTPLETISYYKQRTDYEQRVHSEVDLLVTIAINETLDKVEEWMDKYDKDMETIDLKIQIKKNEYQNMLDRRVGLEDTIEKHDQKMKAWINFKDEREKARLYREKMTNSAVTVQAWWRGLLVRLQLGPYKVAKKKGAPQAAAGGKKK